MVEYRPFHQENISRHSNIHTFSRNITKSCFSSLHDVLALPKNSKIAFYYYDYQYSEIGNHLKDIEIPEPICHISFSPCEDFFMVVTSSSLFIYSIGHRDGGLQVILRYSYLFTSVPNDVNPIHVVFDALWMQNHPDANFKNQSIGNLFFLATSQAVHVLSLQFSPHKDITYHHQIVVESIKSIGAIVDIGGWIGVGGEDEIFFLDPFSFTLQSHLTLPLHTGQISQMEFIPPNNFQEGYLAISTQTPFSFGVKSNVSFSNHLTSSNILPGNSFSSSTRDLIDKLSPLEPGDFHLG